MFDGPDYYGDWECRDGDEDCLTAKAIRKAAADKVIAAIAAEYGGTSWENPSFPLESYPAREWVCMVFPWRHERPCPGCGYVPRGKPAWADFKVKFALGGKTYRIVSIGSTNRFAPRQMHQEDFLICELISSESWSLPAAPATRDEVGKALDVLDRMPRFRAHELEGALHLVDDGDGR